MKLENQEYDDLEIRVFAGSRGYTAELSLPDRNRSYAELPPLPLEQLEQAQDAQVYGTLLYDWLFQKEIKYGFRSAEIFTETRRSSGANSNLRFRLSLDPDLPELHGLHWESLYAQDRGVPLSLSTTFSRYMHVRTRRPLPSHEPVLRLLLVTHVSEGTPIDAEILPSAVSSEQFLQVDLIPGPTFFADMAETLKRCYHVLHLVAAVAKEEDEDVLTSGTEREVYTVSMAALTDALNRSCCPALIYLDVETPAVSGESEVIPRLASPLLHAGAQAIVATPAAMGANYRHLFRERFYDVLLRTGIIDQAMTMARSALQSYDDPMTGKMDWHHWDWVLPELYMRTPDAQLFERVPQLVMKR